MSDSAWMSTGSDCSKQLVLQVLCPSCHPNDTVKALEEIMIADSKQRKSI